jgi:hypothetical protein
MKLQRRTTGHQEVLPQEDTQPKPSLTANERIAPMMNFKTFIKERYSPCDLKEPKQANKNLQTIDTW